MHIFGKEYSSLLGDVKVLKTPRSTKRELRVYNCQFNWGGGVHISIGIANKFLSHVRVSKWRTCDIKAVSTIVGCRL